MKKLSRFFEKDIKDAPRWVGVSAALILYLTYKFFSSKPDGVPAQEHILDFIDWWVFILFLTVVILCTFKIILNILKLFRNLILKFHSKYFSQNS